MKFFHGKRVVVTGAGGFIGSHIVRLLRNTDCTIVRALRAPAPPLERGRARVKDVVGDVREPAVWRRVLPGADVVFHLAAQTSANVAEADPAADREQNVVPMQVLLAECRRRRPAIVFASTVTIVGIPTMPRVNESVPDAPITAYDRDKQEAEVCLAAYPRGVSLRLANVYGFGPPSRNPDRGMLNGMIARATAGEALTIFGSGDRVRDFVHVDDVARAFLAAAQRVDALAGRYFVIGSGRGHSIEHAIALVARRAARATGVRPEVRHVAPPLPLLAIDGRDFVADARAFRRITGWKPRITLAHGVDRTIASLLASARAEQRAAT